MKRLTKNDMRSHIRCKKSPPLIDIHCPLFSAASALILSTASLTFALTTPSQLRLNSVFENSLADIFLHCVWTFGSLIANKPSVLFCMDFSYHALLVKGEPGQWISLNSGVETMEASSGETRTIGR
jgi:hypothetical protein